MALFMFFLAGFFYWASFQTIQGIDDASDAYFQKSVQSATLAYASLRGVNAVVSVIKDSSIELSPAGVGLSVAAGQVLDPVDDMTERASSVVVAVLVSLGIQKLGYEAGQWIAFQVIAVLLVILGVLVGLGDAGRLWRLRIFKWILMLLLLRFMLPVMALGTEWTHDHYFQPRQAEALDTLGFITEKQVSLESRWAGESGGSGWWSTLKERQEQTQSWFQTLSELSGRLEAVIGALLTLMMLWLVEWLLQILLLPLISIGLVIYVLKRLKPI